MNRKTPFSTVRQRLAVSENAMSGLCGDEPVIDDYEGRLWPSFEHPSTVKILYLRSESTQTAVCADHLSLSTVYNRASPARIPPREGLRAIHRDIA